MLLHPDRLSSGLLCAAATPPSIPHPPTRPSGLGPARYTWGPLPQWTEALRASRRLPLHGVAATALVLNTTGHHSGGGVGGAGSSRVERKIPGGDRRALICQLNFPLKEKTQHKKGRRAEFENTSASAKKTISKLLRSAFIVGTSGGNKRCSAPGVSQIY